MESIYWIIYWLVVIICGTGCFFIIKTNVLRYGIIFLISILLSVSFCIFFYFNGFYRFVLPIYLILLPVICSFGFLILFLIKYRPTKYTFPFYFSVLTFILGCEIFLKDVVGFIVFRNGWDLWDSYSFYWVYVRIFDFIGERVISEKWRKPVPYDKRMYWIIFLVMIVISFVILGYTLNWWL
ncbi:hypothetical protein [Litchfieldia alkalitelluris]|uniref:hypothetical protein n=1 Tax=Litchfieldia alkalitelluris TaxID=304268 RepID=UPI00099765F8|nr:hypothetical protein [Litchfieldia alkalitelluris]